MVDASSPGESIGTTGGARDDTPDRPKKARRMFLTQHACQRCRQKKSKCDGLRPQCGRCEKNGAECVYDVAQEGVTRMQSLQQRLEESESNARRRMLLINALQRGSDDHASNLLARLRMGDNIENLITSLEVLEGGAAWPEDEMRDTGATQAAGSMRALALTGPSQGSWAPWTVHGPPNRGAMSSHGGGSLTEASPTGELFRIPDGRAQQDGDRGPGQRDTPAEGQYPPRDAYYRPDPGKYFDP